MDPKHKKTVLIWTGSVLLYQWILPCFERQIFAGKTEKYKGSKHIIICKLITTIW